MIFTLPNLKHSLFTCLTKRQTSLLILHTQRDNWCKTRNSHVLNPPQQRDISLNYKIYMKEKGKVGT